MEQEEVHAQLEMRLELDEQAPAKFQARWSEFTRQGWPVYFQESKSNHSFGQPRSMEALLSMIKLDTSKYTASPMTIRPATQFAPKRANGNSRASLNAPSNSSRLAAAYSKPQARARLFKSDYGVFYHK